MTLLIEPMDYSLQSIHVFSVAISPLSFNSMPFEAVACELSANNRKGKHRDAKYVPYPFSVPVLPLD